MKLIMENIRGFAGRHEHEIRPITLLIGENSTGKTTFGAMLHAVLHPNFPFDSSLFGRQPYQFNNLYDTIARKNGGETVAKFSLGLEIEEESTIARFIPARFTSNKGAPKLESLQIIIGDSVLIFSQKMGITVLNYGEEEIDIEFPFEYLDKSTIYLNSFHVLTLKGVKMKSLLTFPQIPEINMKAFSPMRAKPNRVSIDPSTEFDPEGNHIPALLRDMNKKSKAWKQLEAILTLFGRDSGLFEGIRVMPAAAFYSLQAKVGEDWRSLTDVGYGISQILPVLVESSLGKRRTVFILQQPEVHLHPKAQAALGTFFARLVKEKPGTHFVLETHSDHLVDRIRQEIGNELLTPKDVNLLYFERQPQKDAVAVHQIELNKAGGVVDSPPGYRLFFLEEMEKSLELY